MEKLSWELLIYCYVINVTEQQQWQPEWKKSEWKFQWRKQQTVWFSQNKSYESYKWHCWPESPRNSLFEFQVVHWYIFICCSFVWNGVNLTFIWWIGNDVIFQYLWCHSCQFKSQKCSGSFYVNCPSQSNPPSQIFLKFHKQLELFMLILKK